MANNISIGPNGVIAKVTAAFSTITEIDPSSVAAILEVGATLREFYPAKARNELTGFIIGRGYIIHAKEAMDLTAYVVPPFDGIAGPAVLSIIRWDQFQNADEGSPGDLENTGSIPSGATGLKRLIKADGNYIQMPGEYIENPSLLAMLGISGSNDADYDPDELLAGFYFDDYSGGGSGTANVYLTQTGTESLITTILHNNIIKLEVSGDNLLLKKSTDGTTFSTISTLSGILSGLTNLYIKAIFLDDTNRHITNAKGYGLITI